jgi:hypothetical protein
VIDAFTSALGVTLTVGAVFSAAALAAVMLLPRSLAPEEKDGEAPARGTAPAAA